MLLSDNEIRALLERGQLVQDMVDPKIQVQQCGVDLTVAKVFSFAGEGVLDFDNKKRKIPEYMEIKPKKEKGEEFWVLEKGVYHIAFNEKIILPKNIAGLLMPRSSALTCGIVQHTAVWDPGYSGRSFFHAEVFRPVKIYKNARLGQMIFIRLSSEASPYTGTYHGEDILKFSKRGGLS
jgi:dUTP pyrophosphatase